MQIVQSSAFSNGAGAQTRGQESCPAGTKLIGGGVFGTGGTEQSVNGSFPVSGTDTWVAYMNNTGSSSDNFYVYAICAKVAS